jgi:hypothetical protein
MSRFNRFGAGFDGANHDGRRPIDFFQLPGDLNAVEERHAQIENRNIGPVFADHIEGRLAIFSGSHNVDFRCQNVDQVAQNRGVVIGDDDSQLAPKFVQNCGQGQLKLLPHTPKKDDMSRVSPSLRQRNSVQNDLRRATCSEVSSEAVFLRRNRELRKTAGGLVAIGRHEVASVSRELDCWNQIASQPGLQHVTRGSRLQGGPTNIAILVNRMKDDLDRRVGLTHTPRGLDSIDGGQREIEHEDVWKQSGSGVHSRLPVRYHTNDLATVGA